MVYIQKMKMVNGWVKHTMSIWCRHRHGYWFIQESVALDHTMDQRLCRRLPTNLELVRWQGCAANISWWCFRDWKRW